MNRHTALCIFLLFLLGLAPLSGVAEAPVPEQVYRGDLIAYPGPWAFQLGRSSIILVNDQDLLDLTDPEKKVDLSTSYNQYISSLREICEHAQRAGHQTLIIAFDQFFSQYRPGQVTPRQWMPDMDEYIEKIAAISHFAAQYGLGLELSLLSPLEIGPTYAKRTGESGQWLHYRKGLRDPETGAYSVQLWQQKKWANNKGAVHLEEAGVRVFAFKERRISGTPYIAVDPEGIVDISATAKVEKWPSLAVDRGDYRAERIRIHGEGMTDIGPLDRVVVVQQYKTPEMDYFSPNALPFLKTLVDKYVDAGVKLNALYSDEMHIQQDWGYFNHHDNGELAVRYVSAGFAKAFAQAYGQEYTDLAKYALYFVYGQEDTRSDTLAKLPMMHVFGDSPEAIRQTALFRSRYYRMLQDGVVDLFTEAKRHAEQRYGFLLHSRAHATWAESPTIDQWEGGQGGSYSRNYEYTSDFLWSNTVHQSAAACSDYFKWGEFLTGTGNDHCECGWLDRNYTGIALAASTGILNEIPHSYAAHWGMPSVLWQRRMNLVSAAGACGAAPFTLVQDSQHRDTDVLTLYPIDLVSVDEGFGSWMTQYAYCNYITQDKLLEKATVKDGILALAGRAFTTLTIAFEPFPDPALLHLIADFTEQGGRVIWSGPPPVLSREGKPILDEWTALFGITYQPSRNEGQNAVGQMVTFHGKLVAIPPQTILTHFLIDHIYPVQPGEGVQTVATVNQRVVGTTKSLPNGGSLTFLGFRPRDDQAQSLGYDIRTWFDILSTLGAYPPSGKFPGVNDNPDYLSRTGDSFVNRFPNGTIALAPHLKTLVEDWPGGFARNEEEDKKVLDQLNLPPSQISLQEAKINGHTVTYEGSHVVAFRLDSQGNLLAFAGHDCTSITLDGRTFTLAEKPLGLIAFAPVPAERQVEQGAAYVALVHGVGDITLPIPGLASGATCYAQ
ncbi:MAG: hypothetical protein RBU29_17440, partial [bacterium]|nr:hypothetical protein [bacterium]